MTGATARELRSAMARFPTGVAVVTTLNRKAPIGMTANSLTSVSLDPPLVLWCIARQAPSFDAFKLAPIFAVNVLAKDQLWMSHQFSRSSSDKFAGVEWRPGVGDVPVILGCSATFECELVSRYGAGDHEIHLGKVLRTSSSQKPSLAYYESGYAELHGMLPHGTAQSSNLDHERPTCPNANL
jgi:flavin reductase (DIM6/NTAB) family NADH-FMN oxidoreductase RutF